ncbi:amino acid--tRNA ligase-related protein [Nonomuraea typhae]|uniref:Amino acid--tRNA ligase-related protein n=1 Tax=Nonomuraea typhae TaxID=2603600 RepID=A0ABW7YT96_9ACTN
MISRILSAELSEHAGQRVTIAGWVHRRRQLKSVSFLVVRDRAGLAQVVTAFPDLPGEECVVEITGTVTPNPQAPGGAELTDPEITVLGEAARPPFELFRPELGASLPVLLDHAPLALRHPALRLAQEVSAAGVAGFREALDRLAFTEIHTPKLVGGQRLHRHADYLAALAERGEAAGPYQGYLQAFAYGMPPHGGFAIGLERWTARLIGAANIRQATLFPRDLHRLSP